MARRSKVLMAVAVVSVVAAALATKVFSRDDYAGFSLTKALEYPPPTDEFQKEKHDSCVAGAASDCHWLSLFFDKEPMRKRFLNERACLLKHSDACVNIAVLLWNGSGELPQDKERAVRIVEKICAEQNTWYSCEQMSAWTGKPAPTKDKADATTPTPSPSKPAAPNAAEKAESKSTDELERACEDGAAAPCFDLAQRLASNGDKITARRYYHRACIDLGDALSCNRLGLMQAYGEGGPKDERYARVAFEKGCAAANESQGWSCDEWGVLLFNGDGGWRDRHKAAELFEKSCNLNYAHGCFHQGVAVHADYSDGKGPGPSGARDLYAKACELGDEEGCRKAEWKKEYWCRTDFGMQNPDGSYATFCRNSVGQEWDANMIPKCLGAEGWCD